MKYIEMCVGVLKTYIEGGYSPRLVWPDGTPSAWKPALYFKLRVLSRTIADDILTCKHKNIRVPYPECEKCLDCGARRTREEPGEDGYGTGSLGSMAWEPWDVWDMDAPVVTDHGAGLKSMSSRTVLAEDES